MGAPASIFRDFDSVHVDRIPEFVFFLRFYLFIHKRHTERQRYRQREKQAPRSEPDVGLDPGTPGPRPEPKADTQPLSHPGIPKFKILNKKF